MGPPAQEPAGHHLERNAHVGDHADDEQPQKGQHHRTSTALDPLEPEHVGEAVAKLGLNHVVITSVDRDDLDDGGAAHFAAVIRAIRAAAEGVRKAA